MVPHQPHNDEGALFAMVRLNQETTTPPPPLPPKKTTTHTGKNDTTGVPRNRSYYSIREYIATIVEGSSTSFLANRKCIRDPEMECSMKSHQNPEPSPQPLDAKNVLSTAQSVQPCCSPNPYPPNPKPKKTSPDPTPSGDSGASILILRCLQDHIFGGSRSIEVTHILP